MVMKMIPGKEEPLAKNSITSWWPSQDFHLDFRAGHLKVFLLRELRNLPKVIWEGECQMSVVLKCGQDHSALAQELAMATSHEQ